MSAPAYRCFSRPSCRSISPRRHFLVALTRAAQQAYNRTFSSRSTAECQVRIRDSALEIASHDGSWSRINARWLRDNCSCTACRNQQTGQRQINVFKDLPNAAVSSVEQAGEENASYKVLFNDGHRSTFSKRFLQDKQSIQVERWRAGYEEPSRWSASTIEAVPPIVSYQSWKDKSGVANLLKQTRSKGFCFVDNMPDTPEASQQILESIGPIRNTHYGGFYDFTSDLSSKDTAYTSESLEPHTDTTYFTDPIGLQALHLLSHTDGEGGLSSLVDGFQAAEQVRRQDPRAYEVLSTVGVYAHASGNEGISIQLSQAVPVLSLSPGDSSLMQVRWNNADRAGLAADHGELMDEWYDAAAKFDAAVSDPANQYWFQLQPGKMLIFDNWRVLHGRSAFTGKRRMCGGYINRDDWISKYRMTNLTPEEIEASTVTG